MTFITQNQIVSSCHLSGQIIAHKIIYEHLFSPIELIITYIIYLSGTYIMYISFIYRKIEKRRIKYILKIIICYHFHFLN